MPQEGALAFPLRDAFDVPDLQSTHDDIVNGFRFHARGRLGRAGRRSPRSASIIRWPGCRITPRRCPSIFRTMSCSRTTSSTWTSFVAFAREALADPGQRGIARFVGPGNDVITEAHHRSTPPSKLPQMPTYHLTRDDGAGITLVNIGVGPSNSENGDSTTSPSCARIVWLMVGHCAGPEEHSRASAITCSPMPICARTGCSIGTICPLWVPIPALAEVQIALEEAVEDVAEVSGYDLKRIIAHRHRRHRRQPQLGAARPCRPGAAG